MYTYNNYIYADEKSVDVKIAISRKFSQYFDKKLQLGLGNFNRSRSKDTTRSRSRVRHDVLYIYIHYMRYVLSVPRDVDNFFSMSDIWSDKLRKFARPNENMPDQI